MTLEIIGFPGSNFVRAVRMFAHEKGVEYDYTPATPHSDEVKAVNPFGQIPGIRHGDVTLSESCAIMRYMDKVCDGPKLIPEDPAAAAELDRWMSAVASTIDRWIMRHYVVEYIFNKDEDGNPVREDIDKAVKRIPGLLKRLSGQIGDGYLVGDEFSPADCLLVPMLLAMGRFPEGKEFMEQFPNLQTYVDKVSERESFKATQPS